MPWGLGNIHWANGCLSNNSCKKNKDKNDEMIKKNSAIMK